MLRSLPLIIVLAASPAVADTELSIGGNERSLRTSSANAVTADNLTNVEFSLARDIGEDLGIQLMPDLHLWAVASWRYGYVAGDLFESSTEATTNVLTLGGRARYSLNKYLAAHVRGELGTQQTSLSLTYGTMDRTGTASDSAWGPVAVGSAGVDAVLPVFGGGALGVRFELGYVATSGLDLAPSEMRDEANLSLGTAQASIGSLDLQGRFWALSVFAQF